MDDVKNAESGETKDSNGDSAPPQKSGDYLLPASALFAFALILGSWIYLNAPLPAAKQTESAAAGPSEISDLDDEVLPPDGVILPFSLGDIGVKLVSTGVIDLAAMEALYEKQGRKLPEDVRKLLYEASGERIKMTAENSGALLNFFWALGLGNKNQILENGPMSDERYGGPENFASTGGWTLAKGGVMRHYGKHPFIVLNGKQQETLEKIAGSIYRPCCGNSTYFPDCNHGMAMLGLLELMIAQGVSEEEVYKTALAANSYWFPDNYLTVAKYLKERGIAWEKANAREILGAEYSSASGYLKIFSQVKQERFRGGGSCGIQ